MRVLVTGASGLIGSAVCDALLARGDEVVGLSRDPTQARGTNPTVTWHRWDAANERPPKECFAEVDAVVNLVGEEINQRLTPEAKQRIRASRVRATKNLVDGLLAAEPSPPTLVSQAAIGIYGNRGSAIVDESTPPGDDFLAQLVADWEREARMAEEHGVRVVILRSAPLLDPGGGLLKQLLPVFRLGLGGPLGRGDQYLAWIHPADEVGLILWALDNPQARGTYNAAAPHPVTSKAFAKQLGAALRRPAVLPAPRFALVAMRGSELTESLLSSLRVVPRRAADEGYAFRFPELGPALADLLR
jgi:uncharacterized protein